jgi:hypothetical protein
LYEDALESAENALKINNKHEKSLYRKANALLFLHKID